MSSTAFKLGTTLTQGWFWARRCGCTAVYRGPSAAQVDFNHILQVADPAAGEIVLAGAACLIHRSRRTAISPDGSTVAATPERTTAAAVMVRIGPDGRLAPPAPNAVLGLKGEWIGGHRLRLIWFYRSLDQETAPQEFHIYWDSGAGQIDLEHPLATVPYEGRRFYQWETGPLGAGQYMFAVRPCGVDHTRRHVARECCVPGDGPVARSAAILRAQSQF